MKKTVAALGLLVLAACTENLPPPAPVTNHVLPPKIVLDVQAINLADRSGVQPGNSPYNSNHFAPTINEAIRQWAADRLQAGGQTGQGIVLIKDASLTSSPLNKKDGVDGWFTRQQTVRYTGHADIAIEANGRPGFANTEASATRSVTLPENPTPTEKQDAYYSLLNGLMKDLGQNMEAAIQAHMASFVMAAPKTTYGTRAMPTSAVVAQPLDSGASSFTPSLPPAPPTPAPIDATGSPGMAPSGGTSDNAPVIPLSGYSR